jgi:multisubunit Na+/H+ antiporter MnhG subunit
MNRKLGLALGMLLIFAASVGVLVNIMPAPHKPTDFLVIGAVGTLLSLLLLFVVLIKSAEKPPSRKPDAEE